MGKVTRHYNDRPVMEYILSGMRLSTGWHGMMYPFLRCNEWYQKNIVSLYTDTFKGVDELNVDALLSRELFGVIINDKLLGFVAFSGNILEYLAVIPTDRGRGIGSIVMYGVMSWCSRKGYGEMYLECKEGLIPYYKRFGGREIIEGKRVIYNQKEVYGQMIVDV